ncbi:hypothetical protein [Actimicrobium sp. GrIS 1.19]|uniref:hypothetical protein n=1 Tax=Actimicrobium sp. GrIS 1.19 TaxID=3071708 RepID=UPI002E13B929
MKFIANMPSATKRTAWSISPGMVAPIVELTGFQGLDANQKQSGCLPRSLVTSRESASKITQPENDVIEITEKP